MLFLADHALQSRWRALLITLCSAASMVFCWIGAAIVALITLRKGSAPGAWLAMWALLPAGVVAVYYGDAGPLSLVAGSYLLACVLRATVSLPLTVLMSIVVGVSVGVAMLVFGQSQLALMTNALEQMLSQFSQRLAEQGQEVAALTTPGTVQVAGMLGLVSSVGCLLSVLLARYWQASLFNPGGFGEEFRALRLPLMASAGLVVVFIALLLMNTALSSWAMIVVLPLQFAGLALVHDYAHRRKRGTAWLVLFYSVWLLLEPVKWLVAALAFADSVWNLRQRIGPDQTSL